MSSPADSSTGDGGQSDGTRPAPVPASPAADRGGVPPWQRGAATPAQEQQTRQVESTAQRVPAAAEPNSRVASGTSAPSTTVQAGAAVDSEAYRSELPDLSGLTARPVQQNSGTQRESADDTEASSLTGRIQVGSRQRGPVRASMQIRRVDPWTVLKVSLVLSVALFFVWMIAVAFLYLTLGGMGVWSKLNSNVGDLLTNTANTELVSSGAIFGGATLIGLLNIVLLTAMATVGAFIYNLTTDLVGGVEVTLADRD